MTRLLSIAFLALMLGAGPACVVRTAKPAPRVVKKKHKHRHCHVRPRGKVCHRHVHKHGRRHHH